MVQLFFINIIIYYYNKMACEVILENVLLRV